MFHSWLTYDSERLELLLVSSTLQRDQRSLYSWSVPSVFLSLSLYRTTVTFSVMRSPSSRLIWYGFSLPAIFRICSKRSTQYWRADSKALSGAAAALLALFLAWEIIAGPPII